MDGTAKGGIAIAIQAELGIPVKYIGVGEQIDDLQKFRLQTRHLYDAFIYDVIQRRNIMKNRSEDNERRINI